MTRFEVIQSEWGAQSAVLAEWAMNHLTNRLDRWGQYAPLSKRERENNPRNRTYKALTLPARDRRDRGDQVTLAKLQRHFAGRKIKNLLGLHCRCSAGSSRWFGIDIDLHDEHDFEDHYEYEAKLHRNHRAAITWWERLQGLCYDPILFDSNGGGGYHLWTLFSEPCPTPLVYEFAHELVRDWAELGLDAKPEIFRKNDGRVLVDPKTGEEKMGTWFRLPGRHHTREHFHRVWSGEPWLDEPWLEGEAAIQVMLENNPGRPLK